MEGTAKEQTNFLRTVLAIFPCSCSCASGTSGTRLSNAFWVVPSSCVGARRYQPTRPAAPLACWAPTTEAAQGSCSGSSEVAENRRMAQRGYSYNGSLCNRSNGCLTAALGTGFQPPGCRHSPSSHNSRIDVPIAWISAVDIHCKALPFFAESLTSGRYE